MYSRSSTIDATSSRSTAGSTWISPVRKARAIGFVPGQRYRETADQPIDERLLAEDRSARPRCVRARRPRARRWSTNRRGAGHPPHTIGRAVRVARATTPPRGSTSPRNASRALASSARCRASTRCAFSTACATSAAAACIDDRSASLIGCGSSNPSSITPSARGLRPTTRARPTPARPPPPRRRARRPPFPPRAPTPSSTSVSRAADAPNVGRELAQHDRREVGRPTRRFRGR